MTEIVVASSIMGTNALGMLIPLGIENYFDVNTALMLYNYIAIFAILIWAGFASQFNESRYTFTTPFLGCFFVWIGWIHAPNAASYWGQLVFLLLLGGLMYANDMNHEKYGLPGPGEKLLTIAFMIMVFTASMGLVLSGNILPTITSFGSTQNVMCGSVYTCDSSGQIVLDASVHSVSNAGGLWETATSTGAALGEIAVNIIMTAIVVVGSVLFIGVILCAAYPVLLTSPQALLLIGFLNVIVWVIYFIAFFNWFYKPPIGTGQV
jgi:hypothetical protein